MIRIVFAALFAVVMASVPLRAAFADVVKLSADEWCPYNCAPGSQRPGYLIEIATEALKDAGHTVEYTTMPWNRALFEMKSGRIDGAVGASPAEGEAVYPKQPLGLSRNVLAMTPDKANGFVWTGVESLKTLHLGGAQGYAYDQGPIDAYIAGAGKAVELLSGTEVQSQNLRKLLAGRLDAVIEDENVMRLTISEMQPRPDVRLLPIGEPTVISIAFSPAGAGSHEFVDRIDAFVVQARADGRLKSILARYGVDDWQR